MDQHTDRRGLREASFGAPPVGELSPYRRFGRDEWAGLRADTPMTLDEADLGRLRGAGYNGTFRDVATGVKEYVEWLKASW